MTNLIQISEEQKKEVLQFLELNKWSNTYHHSIKMEEGNYNPYLTPKPLIFEDQDKRTIETALNDIELFKEREQNYKARQGFKVGEVILLPDGQKTHITHVWEDGQLQTGSLGSCHLSTGGYLSRSGSLNSGLKSSDLIPTNKTEKHAVWIFHNGSSGANRGVYFPIEFNVYEVKKDADLSGCPEVKELAKRKLQEQSETITRINGNGDPYTMHMPEIFLQRDVFKDIEKWHEVKQGTKITLHGLDFVFEAWNFRTQPMTRKQINNFLQSGNYHATFYNNCSHKNALFIEEANNLHKRRTINFS